MDQCDNGREQAAPREPIAGRSVKSQAVAVVVFRQRRTNLVHRKAQRDAAERIDHSSNPVVGDAQQPAAILDCPHPRNFEMLLARRAMSEVAVVRDIHQRLRATLYELADLVWKHRLIADERADAMLGSGENYDAVAGNEIADLPADTSHPAKKRRHEFTERNEMDFVVTIDQVAVGREHYG